MEYLYLPAYKLTSIDADELFYLETLQESIAPLRMLKAHRPWPEARQARLKVAARFNMLNGASGRFRYLISMLAIPNYTRAGDKAVHTETERQMTLATIALKRFQLRHGKSPASLAACWT